MSRSIFDEIKDLVTESRNEKSRYIDRMSIKEILKIINEEDKTVPFAVEKEIPYIAQAVEHIESAFKQGGRLFYVGAGTSGRLGVLDASEIPPTFGADPQMVQGLIAGGQIALIKAQEGAEDDKEKGKTDLMAREISAKDVVCGIAASRRTPYVIGAIEQARTSGASTLYVTCTPRSEMNIQVDVAICPVVGPEVVMGSTRMKAGTATKLVLNMLTSTTMIRMGKVYENMMVDLQMTSKKLEERSKRTVMMVTDLEYDQAAELLEKAGGHVKVGLVMYLKQCDANEAKERLQDAGGFVYRAIQD
ncbi:N-acetylmuramic acid 6-phosphate etherase [candidate division KSB1 bacterium]|nr:N-acetylmuramic acid 6-phosphate etherase [candidate division KSB1 bacterium]